MDSAIVPLVLLALVAGIVSTWIELRASLRPATCNECPHCRVVLERRRQAALEDARTQAELRSWYARRNGLDDREDDDR